MPPSVPTPCWKTINISNIILKLNLINYNGEGFWGLQWSNHQIGDNLSICVFQYYCLSISASIWTHRGASKLLRNYSVQHTIHFFILKLSLGMTLTISLDHIYQKLINFIWNLVALRNMSHFRLHTIKRKLEGLWKCVFKLSEVHDQPDNILFPNNKTFEQQFF